MVVILCLSCARHFLKHVAGSNLFSPHDSTVRVVITTPALWMRTSKGDLMSLAGVTQPGIADTSHALKHQSSA